MREYALESQSTAAIAKTASRDYLAWRIPQILDLQDAIAAANRGEFASDEEVNAFFARYNA